jgi:GNAT superfamily N-acetyltransferase
MNYNFRKAKMEELPFIWEILQKSIIRRGKEGSQQWQDGYPNQEVIKNDILTDAGYVLTGDGVIIGYSAVIFNDEPAYSCIDGRWLTNGDFVVVHRVAVAEEFLGQGLALKILEFIENIALENKIFSVKVDTNFDNLAMLRVLEKSGYTYCGEVSMRGNARKAFEKPLSDKTQ